MPRPPTTHTDVTDLRWMHELKPPVTCQGQ